ncbi:MAG: DNRLRE domain-containing protein [Planctomycetota bacterium]|jgi:hypothetical protein
MRAIQTAKHSRLRLLAAAGATLCILAGPAAAAVTTTFAIDVDTRIDSRDPTHNYGLSTSAKVVVNGEDGSLVRVLFKLPDAIWATPSSQLLSAKVWFYTWQNVTGDRTVTLHPLSRAFVEGAGDDTPSGDGATWQSYDGTHAWSSAGGDYDAGASVDAAEHAAQGAGGWFSWDITSLWDETNLRSYGGMLKMNDESDPGDDMPRAAFTSSEGAETYRPYVEVSVPEPAALMVVAAALATAGGRKRR